MYGDPNCAHTENRYYHSSLHADDEIPDGIYTVCQMCGKHKWGLRRRDLPRGTVVVELDQRPGLDDEENEYDDDQ